MLVVGIIWNVTALVVAPVMLVVGIIWIVTTLVVAPVMLVVGIIWIVATLVVNISFWHMITAQLNVSVRAVVVVSVVTLTLLLCASMVSPLVLCPGILILRIWCITCAPCSIRDAHVWFVVK